MAEVPGIAGQDLPPTDRPGSVELELLRAENERLRAKLSAAETIATERGQRIEDLVAALQGLPQAWMQYLEPTAKPESFDEPPPSVARDPATVIEILAARPQQASSPARLAPHPPSSPAPVPPDMAAAEAAWREVRVLRDRLERERLDKELARLRTRKRRRFRRQGLRKAS